MLAETKLAIFLSVLYNFAGGADGENPAAGLIDVNGTFYGTTTGGGAKCSCGTVYTITTSGTENVLYGFRGYPNDGNDPGRAGVVDLGGVLYGTTVLGGKYGANSLSAGIIYSLSKGGKETVLYNFDPGASGKGPRGPDGGLIAVKGVLYGTTLGNGDGAGYVVFSITPKGAYNVLYSFVDFAYGWAPNGLIYANGLFYGTPDSGGVGNCGFGCGVIYTLTKGGDETVLHTFTGGSDGARPTGLIDVNGTLYGGTIGLKQTHTFKRASSTVFALTL